VKATIAQKVDEVLDHLDNLKSLCELFYHYKQFTIYKSIAASLRLLLSGSNGDEGLIQEILPSGRFFPLRFMPDPATPPDFLALPSGVRIVSGGADVRLGGGVKVKELSVAGGAVRAMSWEELFYTSGASLQMREWLEQPFLRPDRTLIDFIRTVGNKDGVGHFNPTADLIAMQRWGHFHWHIIAGLAHSVRRPIFDQIEEAYPNHLRPVR
jgi:hypothetical protein